MPVLPRVTTSVAENFDREACSASAFRRFLRASQAAPKTSSGANQKFAAMHKTSREARLFHDTPALTWCSASLQLLAKRRQLLLHSRHLFLKLRHFTLQDGEAITA